VYYFRSIFHNWADKYCVKILQNLVPALKKGARIIIHERVLPTLDALNSLDAKRAMYVPTILIAESCLQCDSNMDVGMLQLLNAQQREQDEWPELFRRADARFRYLGARKSEAAVRWIIEAEWEG
jgi:hypothetical protein